MKYSVRVKFHSDIFEVDDDKITVGVRARPEKGKANEEMIKKIARHLKVAPSRVAIISGARSRNKIIEVAEFDTIRFIPYNDSV